MVPKYGFTIITVYECWIKDGVSTIQPLIKYYCSYEVIKKWGGGRGDRSIKWKNNKIIKILIRNAASLPLKIKKILKDRERSEKSWPKVVNFTMRNTPIFRSLPKLHNVWSWAWISTYCPHFIQNNVYINVYTFEFFRLETVTFER